MLLSAVSVLVVVQSISEIPEGLMNNPVYQDMEKLWTCEISKKIAVTIPRKMLENSWLVEELFF
jgi:hypothetical protein